MATPARLLLGGDDCLLSETAFEAFEAFEAHWTVTGLVSSHPAGEVEDRDTRAHDQRHATDGEALPPLSRRPRDTHTGRFAIMARHAHNRHTLSIL